MSKLFYKLGLEELNEIVPVAEVPTVSEQEVELDVNRIGTDVLNDVAQVDVAEADTATLEEVKTALESALKGTCDHSSLVFAKRTLQMVDKRWGFDYPVASMEDSTETLIASMEDGIGQRLKDLGKALLEMLKKLWAKLKEWGNKFLQLIGFKKKKLEEIKERAVLVRDERWEELNGDKWQHRSFSDGSTHATVVFNHPKPVAVPETEEKPAGKKEYDKPVYDAEPGKFEDFAPHLNKSLYILKVEGESDGFSAHHFAQTLKNLKDGVDVSNSYVHAMLTMVDLLRKKMYTDGISLDPQVVHEKIETVIMARLNKRHAKLGGSTTNYTLPGGAYFIVPDQTGKSMLSYPKLVFRPAQDGGHAEHIADKVKWLTSEDVLKVQKDLSDLMDYLTESAQFDADFLRSFETGIANNFQLMTNPLVANHFTKVASEFASSNVTISQQYLRYVKMYSDALSQYLDLCLDHEIWVKRKARFEKHG